MVAINTTLKERPHISIHNMSKKEFDIVCKKLKIQKKDIEENNNELGHYFTAEMWVEGLSIYLFTEH